jgi:hypothetical protein
MSKKYITDKIQIKEGAVVDYVLTAVDVDGNAIWKPVSSDVPTPITKGQLITYSTIPSLLSLGASGQVLTVNNAASTGLTWETPSSITLPYKVYVALVTQLGTDAPTVIVLESTLSGTPAWTRLSTGIYRCTLAGEFTQDKTVMLVNQTYLDTRSGAIQVTANSGLSPDVVQLVSFNRSFVEADDLLVRTAVEIRVYP